MEKIIKNITKVKTSDNAGFAFFAEKNKESFIAMIRKIAAENNVDLNVLTISVYGEWAGPGIQKVVGISMLPQKSMFIFGVKVSKTDDPKFGAYWLDHTAMKDEANFIFNIMDFKTYSIDIDFNMPQLKQNDLIDMTLEVENECPVSKSFGFPESLGEGIVFVTEYKGITYRFKSKGTKHSVSKVKVLNAVDVEKLNSITEFVEYAVTDARFEQAIEKTFLNNEFPTIQKMGDVIRWMVGDIAKEEMDTMMENNLETKDINKYVSVKTKEMFLSYLDKLVMN